ncbi:MAG: hypothetical protein SFT91_01575 [Rickettsiaceae bacterium]|nr:hypothetical protein [Rickettsiaceae bacterium]
MEGFSIISEYAEDEISQITVQDQIKYIALIGMGASIANTKALLCFAELKKPIIFLDSLERDVLDESLVYLDRSNTLFVAISKSGTTDEVLKITQYIIEHKIKNPLIYYVSDNKDTDLAKFILHVANGHYIRYEKSLSGRFSILQNASILPLYLAGANLAALTNKIKEATSKAREDSLAEFISSNYAKNRNIIVLSVHNKKLVGLSEWIKQIIAESLGKNSFGITPVISIGSICEHSQLQLYLDGPDDKMYYIIPYLPQVGDNNLSQSHFIHAESFRKVLENAGRPVYAEKEAELSIIPKWMMTICAIAEQNNINPYTQDAVEKLKKLLHKSAA